jgi:hypothetical protein
MVTIIIKYNSYYVNKEEYNELFNFIYDPTILQSIDKLTSYEFISYTSKIMYKLDQSVINHLEKIKYPIKYIGEIEQSKNEYQNKKSKKNLM